MLAQKMSRMAINAAKPKKPPRKNRSQHRGQGAKDDAIVGLDVESAHRTLAGTNWRQ
jgi:hypothetical protein